MSYSTFYGPQMSGKGLVRFTIATSDAELAQLISSTVILKVDDTKGILLLPCDQVTFKCRAQLEADCRGRQSSGVRSGAGTWERHCELATPVVGQCTPP